MTMTAEQLEELLGKVTQGDWAIKAWSRKMTITGNVHQVCNGGNFPAAFVPAWDNPEPWEVDGSDEARANATLIALAPSLARRVLAAEKLVELLEEMDVEDLSGSILWAIRDYREASK